MFLRNCWGEPIATHLTTVHPGAWSQVDHHIRILNSLLVVFDDQHGVATFLQIPQGINQAGIIARVQPDGRFVQDITHPTQVGAELSGQTNPLRLPAGQGIRAAVQGQIGQADLIQKAESGNDFFENRSPDERGHARTETGPAND